MANEIAGAIRIGCNDWRVMSPSFNDDVPERCVPRGADQQVGGGKQRGCIGPPAQKPYAFMDADYGRSRDADGARLDAGEWEYAFFLLTQVMSHTKADRAVVDAGLKVQSVDSGLPFVFGRDDVEYISCSDEHGVVFDPGGVLKVGDKLRRVPGHCDPTANLHDWYVGVRNGKVETLWPVTARGKAY